MNSNKQAISQNTRDFLLQERIKGERIIAYLRLIILGFVFILSFIVFVMACLDAKKLVFSFNFIAYLFLILFCLIPTLWALRVTQSKKYYNWYQYFFPILDISLTTVAILLNMFTNLQVPKFALIITGAPTFFYFLFLAAAILRNSPASVVVTGVYMSISYAAISFFAMFQLKSMENGGRIFTNNFGQFIDLMADDEVFKIMIFLMLTFILAFIAKRFNKMVESQTETHEASVNLKNLFITNLKDVSNTISSTSSSLYSTSDKFISNVDLMIDSSRQIEEETKKEFETIETTSATIEQMIHTVDNISGSIHKHTDLVMESAASIEEMVSSINLINQTAVKASTISDNLVKTSNKGVSIVYEVADAVKETANESRKIEEIAEIISSIADSTNLLAMNAAIEAAHAGEAGKGFAVVADEIRKLAETTSDNVKKINMILKTVIERINNISNLSGEANVSLQEILGDSQNTQGINSEIRNAMEQELIVINNILRLIQELKSISAEVKYASDEQKLSGKYILETIMNMKSQANFVTTLTNNQYEKSKIIQQINSELARIISDYKQLVEKLERLLKEE